MASTVAVRWNGDQRTTHACQTRRYRRGHVILAQAPGLADVIIPRGRFHAVWTLAATPADLTETETPA